MEEAFAVKSRGLFFMLETELPYRQGRLYNYFHDGKQFGMR